MVQSSSWAADWLAASQEIPRISWNPKVHYRTHKRPPPVPILGQPDRYRDLTFCKPFFLPSLKLSLKHVMKTKHKHVYHIYITI